MSWAAERALAERAAAAAAAILREAAPGSRRVEHKGKVDLVTRTDRRCERVIRDLLDRHTPGIPVLGEEEGGSQADSRWVVDPIDGTTNFVHGFPVYVVSIGLEVEGERVVGVIHDPVRAQVYAATRGGGAWRDDLPLRVSEVERLDEALLATGFGYDRREQAAWYAELVRRALLHSQGLRRAGAAAMDLALVASGSLDGFFERQLHPWDVAAGALLVTEAGGRISSWHGGPLDRHRPHIIATNGRIHDALAGLLPPP